MFAKKRDFSCKQMIAVKVSLFKTYSGDTSSRPDEICNML